MTWTRPCDTGVFHTGRSSTSQTALWDMTRPRRRSAFGRRPHQPGGATYVSAPCPVRSPTSQSPWTLLRRRRTSGNQRGGRTRGSRGSRGIRGIRVGWLDSVPKDGKPSWCLRCGGGASATGIARRKSAVRPAHDRKRWEELQTKSPMLYVVHDGYRYEDFRPQNQQA